MTQNLDELVDSFLLIDFDHTFLSSSLKEEALLFGVSHYHSLVNDVTGKFKIFKEDFAKDQSIDQLSGGEKAILAVIFYSALAKFKKKPIKFLLRNILESLSEKNRKLLKEMTINCHQKDQKFFLYDQDQVVAIYE